MCIGNPVIRESLQEIEMCFENFANFFWTKKIDKKKSKIFDDFFLKFISRSRRIDLNWFQSVSRKINPPIPRGCKKFEKIYGYTSHLRSDFDILANPCTDRLRERIEGVGGPRTGNMRLRNLGMIPYIYLFCLWRAT